MSELMWTCERGSTYSSQTSGVTIEVTEIKVIGVRRAMPPRPEPTLIERDRRRPVAPIATELAL